MSDNEEEEVIIETDPASTDRKIRVYDAKGDFIVTVPAGAKITFGYFNPASPRDVVPRGSGYDSGNVARQTALRIYRTDKDQLACFLGVKGFRDLSLGLTRLTQKVTVERRMVDDEEAREWYGSETRELVARSEDEFL